MVIFCEMLRLTFAGKAPWVRSEHRPRRWSKSASLAPVSRPYCRACVVAFAFPPMSAKSSWSSRSRLIARRQILRQVRMSPRPVRCRSSASIARGNLRSTSCAGGWCRSGPRISRSACQHQRQGRGDREPAGLPRSIPAPSLPRAGGQFFRIEKAPTGKQPYAMALVDRGIMALAGLWENWRSPAGERVRSFAMVTTRPNALCAELHDRMPVVLAPEAWPVWLGEASADPAALARVSSRRGDGVLACERARRQRQKQRSEPCRGNR
jgi:SOS response associated peptidase (SRAP)